MNPCPYCQSMAQPVNVHGHLQCAVCYNNIGPCCQGETCEPQTYIHEQSPESSAVQLSQHRPPDGDLQNN